MKQRTVSRLLLALALSSTSLSPVAYAEQPAATPVAMRPDTNARYADALAKIEQALEAKRREYGIPGMSVAIVKDDQVIYLKGLGLKDLEGKRPVTPDTQFAIGSATKAMTALLAVMSQDEGKLSLDDSPKKQLPYFKLYDPDADARIVLRDLLSHRSGLERTDLAMVSGRFNREELIRIAGMAKPSAKFREKFFYQNIMFTAAGEVIAKAQGSAWEELVRQRIFKPLGMSNSNVSVPEMERAADYAFGYDVDPDASGPRRLPMRDIPFSAAAGAVNSSARDMAQWVRFMLNGGVIDGKRLVSEKGFQELVTPHITMGPKVSYGLGWFLRDWNGKRVIEHGGNIDGFNASVALMPEEKVGFVLLTNVSGSPIAPQAMEAVWSNLVGGSKEGRVASVQAGTQTAAVANSAAVGPNAAPSSPTPPGHELIGSYDSSVQGKTVSIEFVVKEGKVSLVFPGQPPYPVQLAGADSYTFTGLPPAFAMDVKRESGGKVAGLVLKQPQGNLEFKPATAFAAGLSVDELMAKVIDAQGGEANLRRHTSSRVTLDVNFEHQGVRGVGVSVSRAPSALSNTITLTALGREAGIIHDYFDGSQGAEETTFSPIEPTTGPKLADKRIAADFYAPLNWKTGFRSVVIKGKEQVAGEEAYVVVKTPLEGNPVTEYISTKTFRLLQRDTLVYMPAARVSLPTSESYSDFRWVDGQLIPFKLVTRMPGMGNVVMLVTDARFNVPIDDSAFKPNLTTSTPGTPEAGKPALGGGR